jgi:hypothetical protein
MQSLQLHLSGSQDLGFGSYPMSLSAAGKSCRTSSFAISDPPASIEELRACIQRAGEPIRAYLQRWSIMKNSAENISDERAIDAFNNGLRRKDFVEELGRAKPKTLSDMMDIANKCADGEDAMNNTRARSPEEDCFRCNNDCK